MSSNAVSIHHNAALLSVVEVTAPVEVTSDMIDDRLATVLKRLRLPKRLLQRVAGVRVRRMWEEPQDYINGAAQAGVKALAEAGISPDSIGLLINTSVTRSQLEPAVSAQIHNTMGLASSATNFDITNACLGFVNGMDLAATLIDARQIDYAVVVAGEDAKNVQEATVENLLSDKTTRDNFMQQFASLTLGSGAAAAVLGPADRHPEGHRILRGVTRAGTSYHNLCHGNHDGMYTDSGALLENGLELVMDAWNDTPADWNWQNMDRYITHQVSQMHTDAIIKSAGLDRKKIPTTFPELGNIGPAALPITLARELETLKVGDRVLTMGVGSGLNVAMLEIEW
ncbi:MAG TPA: 3-oxoacyl-ACP synthase III [Candidatus Yaniella excrementigallinarum]|nr:3-oxoacyl-ACP synthase III [Candidatus Yaniella excrementigallinarum]